MKRAAALSFISATLIAALTAAFGDCGYPTAVPNPTISSDCGGSAGWCFCYETSWNPVPSYCTGQEQVNCWNVGGTGVWTEYRSNSDECPGCSANCNNWFNFTSGSGPDNQAESDDQPCGS